MTHDERAHDGDRDEHTHDGGHENPARDGDHHEHAHHGSAHEHEHHAHDADEVAFGVLTVSSSRTHEDDPSGDAIVDLLEDGGHAVVRRDLVADDRRDIREWVEEAVADPDVEAAVTTGGTGLSPDDVTIPAVEGLFDREVAGFGERFRARSTESVGSRAMLSDATAGIVGDVPVFCLPGSEDAVVLGVEECVLPVVGHVVGLQRGPESGESEESVDDRQLSDRDALTHVDQSGRAEMVDVGGKPTSRRRAVARGTLHLQPETVEAVRADEIGKGDVLATVRVGAIDAVKHTWETIPMCHGIPITNVETDVELGEDHLELSVAVETVGRTGCEMEALQGVTTGLGVAWDMVKAAEKDEEGAYPETRIDDVRVVEKSITPVTDDEL